MGSVTQRAMELSPALLAMALALLLGTAWTWVLAAAALYAASQVSPFRFEVIFLCLAPVALSLGSRLTSVVLLASIVWTIVAMLSTLPLVLRLAGRVPWRGALAIWMAVPLSILGVALLPWAPSLFASDISTRVQILLLAAVTLLSTSALDALQRYRSGHAG